MRRNVVITGMGIVSCFGSDLQHFYNQLLLGASGARPISSFDVSSQPTQFAAEVTDFAPEDILDTRLIRRVDRFILYAMVAGEKAVQDAKLQTGEPTERVGVIIGSGMGGMGSFSDGSLVVDQYGYKRLTPFFVPSIITNMAGGIFAIQHGFQGPNYSISTACATANNCLLAAWETLQRGDVDVMIAGGAEAAINPIGMAGFLSMKALSKRNDDPAAASRPWDRERDGFVMGEGSGVFVLEEEEHAKKRGAKIYARLLGGFANCDAYHITAPHPEGVGIRGCMEKALRSARILPEQIDYVNAHATSTVAGDVCEAKALKDLFQGHTAHLRVNSTKSMIGHCLGAAGALEAAATVMALQTQKVHPTRNVHNPCPESSGLHLCPGKAEAYPIGAALSNSFGFGGHNCSLVFSIYDG
ncbi:MAG: beta-ketoacyl-ACP synthase II [Chlamydiota bacterium]